MLCVNTFLQTHVKEAETRENYVGSEMPNVANASLGVATHRMPLYFIPVSVRVRLARTLLKRLLSKN